MVGTAALFATYWDDAWHTDIGRDSATIPPHLLLYGSVAVVGVGVVAWGVAALRATRSVGVVLRHRPLLLAGLGGTLTLTSAPIDAAWHSAFGRDSVLWSPPHMLGVFGTLALVTGVLLGSGHGRGTGWALSAAGALVLGCTAVPVLEFETDVPQFDEVLYLPVLIAGTLVAVAVIRAAVPGPLPVARAVVGYVVVRLAVTAGLVALGRSSPDLPVAVLGLALVELPFRLTATRLAAGAAGVAATSWLAAATGLTSVPARAVATTAVPVIVVFALSLLATARAPRRPGPALLVLPIAVMLVATWARPASAHDPGQGRPIAPVTLTAISDGQGTLAATVSAATPAAGTANSSAPTAHACTRLVPRRLVARRAGETVTGVLRATDGCAFSGRLRVAPTGRWFVYAEFHDASRADVEAWVPLDASRPGSVTERRELYVPSGGNANDAAAEQIAVGAALYALGLALLGFLLTQVRRVARTLAVPAPATATEKDHRST
ncbi:hypothetical protein BCD48_36485 [Pseudofrankia sp. BMG5.36]|nr:hypothetical protein BCD48_36485 [Pseudofrankia sp. BMG5.36]